MIEVSLLENRDRTEVLRRRRLDWALFELSPKNLQECGSRVSLDHGLGVFINCALFLSTRESRKALR